MIYLFAVIVVLSVLLGWKEYNGRKESSDSRKERAKMLNAIISKDVQDQINLDLADNTKTEVDVPPPPPEFTTTDDLSDEELLGQIQKEMGEDG